MEGRDITKQYIPILTVIGFLTSFATIIWFASSYATRITINEKDIVTLQEQIRTVPTRDEFNSLKDSIVAVQKSVDALRNALINK